jgi:two-component system phosphate regulon sensor histidine kinase PhoR
VIRNAQLPDLIDRAARGETPETEIELSGLRPRRVLVHASRLHHATGGVLAVFVDVTELRRLEAVRRDFVANASHELRSPLTTVRAAAETLEAVKGDPQAAGRFINLIYRNAERLENIIDDMLELSRIESREIALDIEPLELGPVVERAVAQHSHRAELKQIALSHSVRSGLLVRADRRALEHVLGNLVDNAVKYCVDGASVSVTAREEDPMVQISVTDTGPGIPEQHLPRLFERFYRVDAGRSRELGGTGLGLSIVKHLVEAMGGAVSVESRLGSGSTFSFTLKKA